MSTIKRVTLYKIKSGMNFSDYLKGDLASYDLIVNNDEKFKVCIKYINAEGAKKSEEEVPWIRFLNSGFEEKRYVYNAKNYFPRAIMAVSFEVEGLGVQNFAATFGQHGDSLLDKNRIVHDFGIRVGMNICDTDRLRRVQTMVHESISRQTERQASIGANLRMFGVNTDSEFFRTISGYVQASYTDIVESFRGRDSISIKIPRDKAILWKDFIEICRRLNERYYSKAYQETDFKVYDILRHESDPEIVAQLDKVLCARLSDKDFGKIHLSPPDFIESEDLDFAYIPVRNGIVPPLYDDLRIEDLINVPRRRLKDLSLSTVKSWSIYIYDREQNIAFPKWNAYQCLVAEIELSGKIYVLSNEQWREVSPQLKEKVSEYFSQRKLDVDVPYLPNGTNIFDSKRNQNREEIYNRTVALADPNSFLFDKGKIKIAGQGLYEICDIFHANKHFVHVKRYTSGASSISHIFTQVKIYSHAFSTDADTRRSFVDWIESSGEPENNGKNRSAFKALIPENSSDVKEHEHTVVFCILHENDGFELNDLPFMSQYELMLTHRFLTEDRRYKVGVVFRKVELGTAVK